MNRELPSSESTFSINDQKQRYEEEEEQDPSTTSLPSLFPGRMSWIPRSSSTASSSSDRDAKMRLPESFEPSPYSVLIGRGKVCAEATGNRRLKVIISTFMDEYSKAPTRIEKSIIVSKIVDVINEACPVGGFIKFESDEWWQVSDNMARERVGSLLRDCLSDQVRAITHFAAEIILLPTCNSSLLT